MGSDAVNLAVALANEVGGLNGLPIEFLIRTVYTSRFGIAPDGPASLGYDAANIIIEAIKHAPTLTPAAIRDQIQATQNYRGATILSHFDENRYAIKSAVVNTVKDGKIQLHQTIAP